MSASSETSSLTVTNLRNRLAQTLYVQDVKSKIRRRETVESSFFFCHHHPELAFFQIYLKFAANKLAFYIRIFGQDVRFHLIRYKLFDKEGSLLRERSSGPTPIISEDGDFIPDWGYANFYEFEPNGIPRETDWKVVCVLDYQSEFAEKPSSEDPPLSQLQTDYLDLFESATDANVTFVVKGERILAHRAILSKRCDYFHRMFASGMQETVDKEVEVKDAEPEVFRGLLQYLYSGAPPKNLAEISLKLIIMADKYGVEQLKQIAESYALANLRAENVVETLLVADTLGNEKLMSRARVVLRGSFDVAMGNSESAEMLKSRPGLLLELVSHYVKE